jgi:hypothetical protein
MSNDYNLWLQSLQYVCYHFLKQASAILKFLTPKRFLLGIFLRMSLSSDCIPLTSVF